VVQPYPPTTQTDVYGQQSDPSMKDKAADTAEAAKQAAGGVGQTAAEKAKDVAGEAQRQARDLVGEAREQVNGQVSEQHRNVVDNLHSLAAELSRMANASEQQSLASEIVGQAGERARGVAEWVGNRQPGDLVDEVRSFARRRPGTFLVGALVAGVAVGRLTRGVVAAHSENSPTANGGSGASGQVGRTGPATEQLPTTDVTGYSAPPAHQGLPTAGQGSVYGAQSPYETSSGMPSSNVAPSETSFRPPEPPAPAGPGPVSS
jgi:hypothetical protein